MADALTERVKSDYLTFLGLLEKNRFIFLRAIEKCLTTKELGRVSRQLVRSAIVHDSVLHLVRVVSTYEVQKSDGDVSRIFNKDGDTMRSSSNSLSNKIVMFYFDAAMYAELAPKIVGIIRKFMKSTKKLQDQIDSSSDHSRKSEKLKSYASDLVALVIEIIHSYNHYIEFKVADEVENVIVTIHDAVAQKYPFSSDRVFFNLLYNLYLPSIIFRVPSHIENSRNSKGVEGVCQAVCSLIVLLSTRNSISSGSGMLQGDVASLLLTQDNKDLIEQFYSRFILVGRKNSISQTLKLTPSDTSSPKGRVSDFESKKGRGFHLGKLENLMDKLRVKTPPPQEKLSQGISTQECSGRRRSVERPSSPGTPASLIIAPSVSAPVSARGLWGVGPTSTSLHVGSASSTEFRIKKVPSSHSPPLPPGLSRTGLDSSSPSPVTSLLHKSRSATPPLSVLSEDETGMVRNKQEIFRSDGFSDLDSPARTIEKRKKQKAKDKEKEVVTRVEEVKGVSPMGKISANNSSTDFWEIADLFQVRKAISDNVSDIQTPRAPIKTIGMMSGICGVISKNIEEIEQCVNEEVEGKKADALVDQFRHAVKRLGLHSLSATQVEYSPYLNLLPMNVSLPWGGLYEGAALDWDTNSVVLWLYLHGLGQLDNYILENNVNGKTLFTLSPNSIKDNDVHDLESLKLEFVKARDELMSSMLDPFNNANFVTEDDQIAALERTLNWALSYTLEKADEERD